MLMRNVVLGFAAVVVVCGSLVFGDGGSAAEKAGAVAKARLGGDGEVVGAVIMPVPVKVWDEWFGRLERAEDAKEFNAIFKEWAGQAELAGGVAVQLAGEDVELEAVTDENGRFRFKELPSGKYRVWAELPIREEGTREERLTRVCKDVRVRAGGSTSVELSERFLTLRGWVRDSEGRMLGGARVVGATAPEYDGEKGETAEMERWIREQYGRQVVATFADEEGRFELTGLKAAGLRGVLNYLIEANPERNGYNFFVDIRVAPTESAVQAKVMRVPLVSEQTLYRARRLIEVSNKLAERTGEAVYVEKEELPYALPMVEGNVIEGVEIVLDVLGRSEASR